MLTVDSIVEKYRSIGSEATFAENLRRQGASAAAIKKVIAQRREYAGTDAEKEHQVERFRVDLIASPRAEQITSYLSLFGSHERAIPLWEATNDEPADVFWPVYFENWCDCDGLWLMRKIMLSTLRRRVAALSPIEFMDLVDRSFYDGLPDRVTVFRGCGRRRVRGLPWTIDRAVAEKFARGGRFSQPPDPVIAIAEAEKSDVFFVCVQRKESEIILDPYKVRRLKLEPLAEVVAA